MASTDRVFRAFEAELVKHLSFSFTLGRRSAPSGSFRTELRVWMRNNSAIPLKDLRGSIAAGPAAEFKFSTFFLEGLGAHREAEIARIEARILKPTHNRFAFDRMVNVNVSGMPDLSGHRFQDPERRVTYVAGRVPVADEQPGRQHGLDWQPVADSKPA